MLSRRRIIGVNNTNKIVTKIVTIISPTSVKNRFLSSLSPSFATCDPYTLSSKKPYEVKNLLNGKWVFPSTVPSTTVIDPMNGDPFLRLPDTTSEEAKEFSLSLNKCSKSGLHNPIKDVHRYLDYGEITFKASQMLKRQEVCDYFAKLVQRVVPKSWGQAKGEVVVTQKFLENFSGDNVRMLARSFNVPGDHNGQYSSGYRWPYGPVVLITPFNFPIEIPILQLMGALYMGNKVLLKVDSKVSLVMEQALRMLHECGLPLTDVDFINCSGETMHTLMKEANPRMTLFTGSQRVAELLANDMNGRVKLEDAGFDWKILGPDVPSDDSGIKHVAYQCDQDAYAASGQKCSAQSILFIHENWKKVYIESKIKHLAAKRNIDELTCGPVITVTNDRFESHKNDLLKIPGASIAFGGGKLKGSEDVPTCYGSFEPTAIKIPILEAIKPENFSILTTEIFGPFQILIDYKDNELHHVLDMCERMEANLTAAVVSNDVRFQNKVLGSTVNGTTYVGMRARTTGAPQNHWFGPAGDPRGAGIGTKEAIQLVWSSHREIISDELVDEANWKQPVQT